MPARLHIGQYVYDARDPSIMGVLNSLYSSGGVEYGEVVIRGRAETVEVETVHLRRKYKVDPSIYLRKFRAKYRRRKREAATA